MFKKYYKEANEELTNEVLMSKVLANAHKPPKKRNQYIKYIAPLAAAVFIVSSAVISMPLWQRAEDKNIIENDVISSPLPLLQSETTESNTNPTENPHSLVTASSPEKDNNTKTATVNASEANENNTDALKKQDAEIAEAVKGDSTESVYEAIQPESSENAITPPTSEDNYISTAPTVSDNASGPIASGVANTDMSENMSSDDNSGPIANGSASGGGGGSASVGSGSASGGSSASSSSSSASVLSVYVPTPAGFYVTSRGSKSTSFASDSGATIRVSYKPCSYNSSPSYSESGDNISVSFASGNVAYSVYAVGADRSAVEYIVNSLY